MLIVMMLAGVAVPATAQPPAAGNLFTDAAYADSPEIARDRDWLFNYLSAGKSVEQAENIRNQVDRMSAANVRALLRFYHKKRALEQEREAASRPGELESSGVIIPPETSDARQRQRAYDSEAWAWQIEAARQANRRPRFHADPYMPFSFTPLPLDYSVYSFDPDHTNRY
jgi:hypothetical protein